ncbi:MULTISPECIES: serine/threonine-protein kinase [Mycobacterium]|uniref:non-specific serine/threonine protein kinase n=1 Tax=Mycobacterium kiyosense TaxID=2871094 RepID=A0A9P3Q5M2_9MYCO|nr:MULTISPECIES: serine/threonine-protein kinase [Mycobacterium]BDE12263.1 protein kinase [Mycobacterium sp. 20KCMC460]GLB85131.1 protein kinase [Mycobacterium kiyosense]GLB88501.1 protein kinase [Mycobacterium kiyosense]GLB94870.1 protein kinase [Mycobacterium kiyosense]GLC02032.1 protein kinase [Mycobacterium kiyosense]
MPLRDGDVFAGYTILRLLGSGGMGEVYLAQHPRLPRLEALKILPASLTGDAEFRQRFNREADLAATLWHPHIVGLHDRGEFDDQLWITMDYVEGTDAARLLQEAGSGGLPQRQVLEIVAAVADALDYAHQRNLLHRDVKPANILLTGAQTDQQRILLADFGIARRADEISGLTATNVTVGSIAYAAPEQLTGQPLDGRADQYALAATAFHLLTGVAPYESSNAAVIIGKHLTAPPPVLAEHRPELAPLDAVLTKAMAKDSAQRYARCQDFAQALAAAAATDVAPQRQPATQPAPVWPPVEPAPRAAAPWPVPDQPPPHPRAPWQPGPPPPWQPAPYPAPARVRWPAIVVPLVLAVLLLGAVSFAATQVLRPRAQASTATPQWQPYVDYAKQFTVWLTSLNSQSAASDIQRIIDGSTGEFLNDFANRRADFTQSVIDSKVDSQGTVNGAAFESFEGTSAYVLVAATSKVTNSSGANQDPRNWRLRLKVEHIGTGYKVSKVEFVP